MKQDFPFTDHTEEPVSILTLLSHSYNLASGQHYVEFHFSDGKVLADKLPPDCTRQNLISHLLQQVDSLRAMEQAQAAIIDDE